MKRLLGFAAASALVALSALPGAALASSVTFTDTEGPGLHVCLRATSGTCLDGTPRTSTYTFTLDVDETFAPPAAITAAELVLTLVDDGGSGDGSEKLNLTVDGTLVQHNANANHDAVVTYVDFTSLADGAVTVTVTATEGDFFLEGAKLTIVDDPAPSTGSEQTVGGDQTTSSAAVPAPAAFVLVGAGLVGAAWRRRAAR